MDLYTQKAEQVEVCAYSGDPKSPGWTKEWMTANHWYAGTTCCVTTPDGVVRVKAGDKIVKNAAGEFHVYPQDKFTATFEAVKP